MALAAGPDQEPDPDSRLEHQREMDASALNSPAESSVGPFSSDSSRPSCVNPETRTPKMLPWVKFQAKWMPTASQRAGGDSFDTHPSAGSYRTRRRGLAEARGTLPSAAHSHLALSVTGAEQVQQLALPDHRTSVLQERPHIGNERIPRESLHSPRHDPRQVPASSGMARASVCLTAALSNSKFGDGQVGSLRYQARS